MLSDHIASQIYSNFGFAPTPGQEKVIGSLARFITDPDHSKIFILNGYAGTGKTSIIAAFVATLKELKIKPILLAPTGRAAKVLGLYASEKAYTIHKKIYRERKIGEAESEFSLAHNTEKDACFIIDESSMLSNLSDGSAFGSGCLLEDLIRYVGNGTRCRLIFVGDNAQLPPIGHDDSPALDPQRMRAFGEVIYESLDDVVRQESDSGILFNATLVRCMIEAGIYSPPLFDVSFADSISIDGREFMEAVEECYYKYGRDETIVITRSNKRANAFNQGIRQRVLTSEEAIESGDMLMVVKNNYFYTERETECPMEFIANGDVARLSRIRRFKELYGFHFAEARLTFPDYEDTDIECNILLDTITSDAPSLNRDQNLALFRAVEEDYANTKSKAKRYRQIRENEYYNALQVKFAYAVTCHKAQGGQWSAVFIDRMLFGDEPMSRDLMRWLYTAITRATQRVYFVNFDERFFDSNDGQQG